MQKNILLGVCLLISLSLYADEKKALGTKVATLSGYAHPSSDYSGNILAMSKRTLVLLSPNGQINKQITPNNQTGFFIPTKQKSAIMYGEKVFTFYSLETEQTKLGSLSADACSNPIVLKNGNLLLALKDDSLKIYTPKGSLVVQTNLPLVKTACNLSAFSDGTIAASTNKKIHFLTSELKLFKTIDLNCQIKIEHFNDLLLCIEQRGDIHFISADGEIKSTFKTENTYPQSYSSLPNGLAAFMFSDGYIYFLDAEGKKKFSHFHDTTFYSSLAVVSDKILAYWNRTEIVFLDFEGKEMGTFKMPKERTEHYPATLIGLGNGTVVAQEDSGLMHFISLK